MCNLARGLGGNEDVQSTSKKKFNPRNHKERVRDLKDKRRHIFRLAKEYRTLLHEHLRLSISDRINDAAFGPEL